MTIGFTVGKSLFVEVPAPIADASKLVQVSNHHVLIFDRSGSMYMTIKDLVEDMKLFISERIPQKDTISIAWFSSEGGQHSFVLKNCPAASTDRIVKGLDSLASVLGTTCFSEVLSEVPSVIDDGTMLADTASLLFFTDGYPVVSNVQREMKSVYDAITRIAPKIGNAVIVGYGQYYNKKVLAEMASALGAQLVHASQLTNFYAYLDSGYALLGGAKKVQVHLPDGGEPDLVLTIDKETDGVAEVEYDEDGNVSVPDTIGSLWAVYTDSCPDGVKLGREQLGVVYAAAALMLANEWADEALELMSGIGDVKVVQMVSNAWTLDDYARAAVWMRQAVFNSNARFAGGKKVGCLPDPDAFCVLDALELLSSDSEAFMHPSKGFEYKRTGVPRKRKEGYPPFIDDGKPVALTSITFNESRMNVSLLASATGTVNVGPNDLGLPEKYPCVKFNNYTFVKDGNLNVEWIWAATSKETWEALYESTGAVDPNYKWEEGVPYMVDFQTMPMINSKYTSTEYSAQEVASLRIQELYGMVSQKCISYLLSQMEEEGFVEVAGDLSLEQQEFLASKGISPKGAYQPPTEKGEVSDHYFAKTFSLKVKGWSSIPKVSDVIERVAEGKKLNIPQATVMTEYDAIEAKLVGKSGPERYTALLDMRDDIRSKLRAIRRQLQGIKFAVCLKPGKWFSGMSRQDPVYLYGDFHITFDLGQEKVDY